MFLMVLTQTMRLTYLNLQLALVLLKYRKMQQQPRPQTLQHLKQMQQPRPLMQQVRPQVLQHPQLQQQILQEDIFVGFQRLADGTLRMVYNEANDSTVYKAEDFVQNGASHAYFLGEDVLATASPNAPEFSLSNGRLILNI